MSIEPPLSCSDLATQPALPRWTPAAALAARWLLRPAPWTPPACDDERQDPWESWRLQPTTAPGAMARVGNGALLQLQLECAWGESLWLLHAPTLPLLQMMATPEPAPSDTPPLPEDALPHWAAQAWWQSVARWLLQRGLPAIRLRSLSVWPASQLPPQHGWFQCQQDGEAVVDLLCLQWPADVPFQTPLQSPAPTSFTTSFTTPRSSEAHPTIASTPSWHSLLPLAGRVQLAHRELPLPVWHALAPGDVLLLQHPVDAPPVPCLLSWGDRRGPVLSVPVRVDEHHLTLRGLPAMSTSDASLSSAAAATPTPSAGTDPLQDLQITVHIELDTLPLPIHELAQLNTGSVLPLSVPLSQAMVRLVACGQVVGRAQLVAVGDQLGARIDALGPHHAH